MVCVNSPETSFTSGWPTDLRMESEWTHRVSFRRRFQMLHFICWNRYSLTLLFYCRLFENTDRIGFSFSLTARFFFPPLLPIIYFRYFILAYRARFNVTIINFNCFLPIHNHGASYSHCDENSRTD